MDVMVLMDCFSSKAELHVIADQEGGALAMKPVGSKGI